MAASISEQIRAAAKACLLAVPQIDGVADRVDRGREDGRSKSEQSGINLAAAEEPSQRRGTGLNDKELKLDVQIYVRATQEQVWETVADAIDVAVAARFAAYAWPGAVAVVAEEGRQWDGQGGDDTIGKLTVTYAIRFLNQAGAIDAPT